MDFSHISQEEREKLYNEVWTDPVTVVAPRYNLSDNGLRKHCIKLWIPLPPAGYWAKVKAGQKVSKPDLPKVRGELKRYVHSYAIKLRPDIDKLTDDELKAPEGFNLLTAETISFIDESCTNMQVKELLRNPHKLITEHKEELTYRRKRDTALQQSSFNNDYYNITKSKYRPNRAILPINVLELNINRAYRIIDTLIKTIEDMEGYANVTLDDGKDKGYFVIMHTAFYFEMKEETQKKRKSLNEEETTPNLVLSFRAENWMDENIQCLLEYKDNKNELLECQVGKIVLEMFRIVNNQLAVEKLKDREHVREIEERNRQRRLEQMRKGELEEIKLLQQAASDWDKAQKIRKFADCLETEIFKVLDEEKRNKLIKWLKWARDKADWIDPLTKNEDKVLGKSKHIFEMIECEDF